MLRITRLIEKYHVTKKVIIPLALIAGGILVSTGSVIFSSKQNVGQGYLLHLKSRGISVEERYTLASGDPKNGDSKISGGNIVTFSFVLTNSSNQAARSVTLDTGISRKLLAFIQNVHGTTGISQDTPTVVLKNIVLLPDETQKISFDAQTLYSPKDYEIRILPVLVDPSDAVILTGKAKTLTVAKVDLSRMSPQVKATKEGEQQ